MDGPQASPGANGTSTPTTTTTTSPFPAANPMMVVEYLTAVLQTTLGASRVDLEAVGSFLSKARYSDTVQRCTRFAMEPQSAALYVLKDVVADEVDRADVGAGQFFLL
jgi:dynein heavy chain 1, cytosolic